MDESRENKNLLLKQGFKGGLFAYILCTVLVLILALLVKLFSISTDALPIINQVIKVICIIIGVFVAVKEDKSLLKGAIAGIVYLILTTITFTLLGGEFNWAQLGIDAGLFILCGSVCGGIIGARRN